MFAIDLEALERDNLLEAVYVSPPVSEVPGINEQNTFDEILFKLNGTNEISTSPVDWNACNDKLGRRFAYVRYYLIIIKGGIIPPQYITKE